MSAGIATGVSYEDYSRNDKWLAEIEGAETGILPAIRQAAVVGTNFAMHQYSSGVPSNQIIVPIAGNTGCLMQFGAIVMLPESFPTFVPLSKQLDITDPVERQIAAAFLLKASEYTNGKQPKSISQKVSTMILDVKVHHIKFLTPEAIDRGIGLLESDDATTTCEIGLFHLVQIFNALYAHARARDVVEFPLSIRTPDATSGECFSLVYRHLGPLGFRVGAPDRAQNPEVFDLYTTALTAAVAAVHEAGVLHCDLYLSNVMWKQEGKTVTIKLIDWDTAHLISSGRFEDRALERLEQYFDGRKAVVCGPEHDLAYLSVLSFPYCDADASLWTRLAGNKCEIDDAFKSLLFKSMSASGSKRASSATDHGIPPGKK